MLPVPSLQVFAEHGLTDIEYKEPSSMLFSQSQYNDPAANGDWLSGVATLYPTKRYPLFPSEDGSFQPGQRVSFCLCNFESALALSKFRRQAQLLALDAYEPPLPSSSSIRNSTSRELITLNRSAWPDLNTSSSRRSRYSSTKQVLAWWEDDQGCWLITSECLGKITKLSEYWNDILGELNPVMDEETSTDGHDAGGYLDNGRAKGKDKLDLAQYGAACDILVQIVDCLIALNNKRLVLVTCNPSALVVRHQPMQGTELVRFTDIVPLPGFVRPQEPIFSSTLFTRDPIEAISSQLSDSFIRKHLRYLAPEAVTSRRASPVGDIYSFGVLAYELVTGSTMDGGPESPDGEDVDLLTDIQRHVTQEITSPNEYLKRMAALGAYRPTLPPSQLSEIIMLCLARDVEDRYGSLQALAYDLRKLVQICKLGGDLAKFNVGEVDKISRFSLPQIPIDRDNEIEVLQGTFEVVAKGTRSHLSGDVVTFPSRTVNLWGLSGTGKSRVAEYWVDKVERSGDHTPCLVGYAKLDEHIDKPLSSFVQIFQSLLDRIYTDPKEDPKVWNSALRATLGNQFSIFLSLLSIDFRRIISGGTLAEPVETIDWDNFLTAFRTWSKRVLQLFATAARPLILVVDDIQWLASDELNIWRHIMDGPRPINHAVIVSLFRVESHSPPPIPLLLSASTINVEIGRLTEEGVRKFIDTCLNGKMEGSGTGLESFLYGQTKGSPLYLRTLISTLVKDRVVFFDFAVLTWRFDLFALQRHLADEGVDEYLDRLLSGLPEDAKEMLGVLSCLPSTGFDIGLLSEVLGKARHETEILINVAISNTGAVTMSGNRTVRFAHDRQRTAAYRLMSEDQVALTHLRVSLFLRRPGLLDDYIFDAADHAMAAHERGVSDEKKDELVNLLLQAASRAALSAGFSGAKRFLDASSRIMSCSGGCRVWAEEHRSLYFRFVTLYAEVCGVLKEHEESFEKLYELASLCRSAVEEVKIGTLIVRQLITSGRHAEVPDATLKILTKMGYDPWHPTAIPLKLPRTPEDVYELDKALRPGNTFEEDITGLISSLLAFAGPTIYITDPERRGQIYALGISLVAANLKIYEGTSYLFTVYAISIRDIPIRIALNKVAKKLALSRSTSFLSASTLGCMSGQVQCWLPLGDVYSETAPAFDMCISTGNHELSTYILMLHLACRILSARPLDLDALAQRYEVIRVTQLPAYRYLVHAPLQMIENMQTLPENGSPWTLTGAFVSEQEIEMFQSVPMHAAITSILSLRLAVFYDAPPEVIEGILEAGRKVVSAVDGLVFGVEWSFLSILCSIRKGDLHWQKSPEYLDLQNHSGTVDFRLRLDILKCLQAVWTDPMPALDTIESTLAEFGLAEHHPKAGLLAYYTSQAIFKATNNMNLASGYIRASFVSYRTAGYIGLCRWLEKKYPAICADRIPSPLLPSTALRVVVSVPVPPALRRASLSTSETVASVDMSGTLSSSEKTIDPLIPSREDNLDTLTLMRSSLALAGEKDPMILLSTLLRILCQYVRADYAAIALFDDADRSILRLQAAGPYGRIIPFDLSMNDEACHEVCPASYMLHVARTGKSISTSSLPRLRADSFYAGRTPRTLLCLPIMNQGVQSGVITLSSATSVSSQAHSANAREVISTLATFATIIISNHSFTRRLKAEVDQRTKELSNALQAKTVFLSQCSHELRSPLSAVLGLAAVLEASPGLTAVQREHLRTISSSGEDLLGLINNILDHSRLESHSVTLERIPFSLRELVETALDTMAPMAQNKDIDVCLTSSFKQDPPQLLGDPFRIKQVLLNLLSNAVKFTPPGGQVTVKWRTYGEPEDRIRVVLEVQDTGVGIPSQKMDKLFHSFSQLDASITRSYGGSGLGLIISKNLAILLGGDCTAASEFGKGSTFTFSFVADQDPSGYIEYEPFKAARSCFVLCPLGPWWDMLGENLKLLNCKPVRFVDSVHNCLVKKNPDGLNDDKQMDLIIVDTHIVTHDQVRQMQDLQPNAKFIYLVRAIDLAEAMQGFNITRESIVARPIKFSSLYNALVPSSGPDSKKASITSQSSHTAKKKINKTLSNDCPLDILLVDDNPVNISVGSRILEMFGYRNIATASDGLQAVEAAEKHQYDLIFCDLSMPICSGFEAQQRIQDSPLAGDPCIVALTANADIETQQQCRDAGFFSYLSKPLNIPKLEAILEEVYHYRSEKSMASSSIQ